MKICTCLDSNALQDSEPMIEIPWWRNLNPSMWSKGLFCSTSVNFEETATSNCADFGFA
jgi:hypothetical protein